MPDKLKNWLTPYRVYWIVQNASLFLVSLICVIASDAVIDNDLLAIGLAILLALVIHLMVSMTGYMRATLEAENKVTLNPAKGKFAVVYYNDVPVSGARLSEGVTVTANGLSNE